MRGINLGGWLVTEKWMTPSLFKGTGARNEHDLARSPEGRKRLTTHHRDFIQEHDVVWLKEQGIEVLRIPFGFWIFGDAPPYVGAIERLDWIVETAGRHGMKVLLDLHGAPGSQNAYEHSGSGNRPGRPEWLLDRAAQAATIDVLVRIATRYRHAPNVWGIELVNEPAAGRTGWKLVRFYRRAYRAVTKHARPGTWIVFSDAYAPLLTTNALGLISRRQYPVAIDSHFYQCFGHANKTRSFEGHIAKTRRTGRLIRFLQVFQPVVVGEWSASLPYPVTKEQTTRYVAAQERAFTPALAHFYWSYKTEMTGRWNFRDTFGS